jgi:hypothetical protein
MKKRNPYIENFCRALVERKGETQDEDAKSKISEDLYKLCENLLGRNMVATLPEEVRAQYLADYHEGSRDVDFDEIARLFESHAREPEKILKETLRQVERLYFKNR